MKRTLLLSALALTLAACGNSHSLRPGVEISVTGMYTYVVKATETVVSVRPGRTGSQFCYTDRRQTTEVCTDLITGQRTVPSGYDLDVVFSEPGAISNITLHR